MATVKKPNKQTLSEEFNLSPLSALKSQDCAAVAEAYERGIAYEVSESSVYAPMKRTTQGAISNSRGIISVLKNYQQQTTTKKPEDLTGVKLGNQFATLPDPNKALQLGKLLRECIPCEKRIIAAANMKLNLNLLDMLKQDVKRRLDLLGKLRDLFTNVDIYGDYCHLLSFLNFMCVPDLQRMLAVLMALLSGLGADILRISRLLLALVLPFFAPLLMSLANLLDQFVLLVTNPLDCIINSINVQLRKLDVPSLFGDSRIAALRRDIDFSRAETKRQVNKIQQKTRLGLMELSNGLQQGANLITARLNFYTSELAKLMTLDFGHNSNLIGLANDKLVIIRLISLVRAMIKAKGQGFVCENATKPSNAEMNIFFDTFLSPNSPYAYTVDPDGELIITRKLTSGDDGIEVKPQRVIAQSTIEALSQTKTKLKCVTTTTQDEAEQVNKWMEELDNA